MKCGASGLRGLVSDMTDTACAAWIAAFPTHLERQGPKPAGVLVGRDLRPSSPRIAAACLGAVRAAGLEAVDCGALPTPALALEAMARGAAAVMVTDSHIPADRNGLTFCRPDGEMTKGDEAGALAARADPAPAAGGGAPMSLDLLDGPRMTLAGDEILHLRGSGNAPALRVYAEAAEPARATALASGGLRRAAARLGRDSSRTRLSGRRAAGGHGG